MAKQVTVHEPSDYIFTISNSGEVFEWVVTSSGCVERIGV